MATASILLDRSRTLKGTTMHPVCIRITHNRKQYAVGMKVYATEQDFNKAMGTGSLTTKQKELRDAIVENRAKAQSVLDNLKAVTIDNFRRFFFSEIDLGRVATSADIKTQFDAYIKELEDEGRPHVNRCNKKRYLNDDEYRRKVIENSAKSVEKMRSTEEGRKKHNQKCLDIYYRNHEENKRKLRERRQRPKEPEVELPQSHQEYRPLTAQELRQALRKMKLESAKQRDNTEMRKAKKEYRPPQEEIDAAILEAVE
jgi:hypothetical protein